MAYEFYVTVEGTKQGKFKGESIRDAHKEKIGGLSFEYEIVSPRDAATGQASGKRQHKPITITKEWGPSSPQIFQALATNEVLKKVLFEFFKTDDSGKEVCYQTIALENGTISKLRQYSGQAGGAKHGEEHDTHELEDVSFTFQKITMTNNTGKTAASDDWKAEGK
jgi:type VI secretion system secreted protein Hcp